MASAAVEASWAAVLFGLDALLVAVSGWLLVRALQRGASGPVELFLGWLLAGLLVIASSAAVLGLVGALGRGGFLVAHALVAGALVWARRVEWRQDGAEAVAAARALGRACREPRTGVAVGLLAAVFAGALVVSAAAVPLVFDALTYRLPRIAHWLQEGRIGVLATDDARLNFMPVGPDLVIAWLLGGSTRGYLLSGWAQVAGGLLLAGATFHFARRTGLARAAAAGAVALVLGMGHVAPQLGSLHTDLFTGGVFAASAVLWLRALERGRGSWLAGAGLGLALGSKGTMLYLLPAAALWAGWHLWTLRPHGRTLAATAAGGVLAVLVFCGPLWSRNIAAYGRFNGPAEAMREHYGPPIGLAQRVEKLAVNLRAAAVQACDPHSQPPWLRDVAHRLGRRGLEGLPRHDAYVFEDSDRVGSIGLYFDLPEPHSDFTGPGLAVLAAAFASTLAAGVLRRRPGSREVLLWSAGVASFAVAQNALFQWHPWGFRYAVLVAPWLGIVVAWGAEQLPRAARLAAWTFLLAGAAWVFGETTLRSGQSPWRGFRMSVASSQGGWHDWSDGLQPAGSPLHLGLPVNSPAAQFFRTDRPRRVGFVPRSGLAGATAEEALRSLGDGWLVVPAREFMGREGVVVASAWVPFGDEQSKISVAGYRLPLPGEELPAVLYSDRGFELPSGFGRALVLRAWRREVLVRVDNPSEQTWNVHLAGPRGGTMAELPPGAALELSVACEPDGLTRLRAEFTPVPPVAEGGRVPVIRGLR